MTFYLNKDIKSGLYSVYEYKNNRLIKVKNPIFSGKDDFIRELKALGFKKSYEVMECFFKNGELVDIKEF